MLVQRICFKDSHGDLVCGMPIGLDLDSQRVYMTVWAEGYVFRITPPHKWWYNSNTGWHDGK